MNPSTQLLEDQLVAQLVGQGCARVAVTDEASMLANLKAQLEAFNGVSLTEVEFTKGLHHLHKIADVFNKAHILSHPDIVEMIERPLKIAERGPTEQPVLEKVVDTCIRGVAA